MVLYMMTDTLDRSVIFIRTEAQCGDKLQVRVFELRIPRLVCLSKSPVRARQALKCKSFIKIASRWSIFLNR